MNLVCMTLIHKKCICNWQVMHMYFILIIHELSMHFVRSPNEGMVSFAQEVHTNFVCNTYGIPIDFNLACILHGIHLYIFWNRNRTWHVLVCSCKCHMNSIWIPMNRFAKHVHMKCKWMSPKIDPNKFWFHCNRMNGFRGVLSWWVFQTVSIIVEIQHLWARIWIPKY